MTLTLKSLSLLSTNQFLPTAKQLKQVPHENVPHLAFALRSHERKRGSCGSLEAVKFEKMLEGSVGVVPENETYLHGQQ